ncbi:hypothetical protein GCM10010124_37350 [Pilimelia terevasa]|uniref:DNA-binding protein n=1 Tax=Pilimelia terevasa TaxID=53372 RepID=A0A8J3FLD2_9ACTN|nr:hypothetical protein [Pilimelia terevasa]GGK41020.1 hypothetical protein GCM10010124_37350 [Pilimelia terevasa]
MWVLEQERATYESAAAGAVHRFHLVLDRAPAAAFPGAPRRPGPAGTVEVGVRWAAADLAAAVAAAVRHAEAAGARVWRVVADDWVTVAEIGVRIGRSRETVRRWAAGSRPPAGFPPPLNPGCAVMFYSWAEVRRWLRYEADIAVADAPPVLAAANLALHLRRTAADIPDAAAIWSLLFPD